MEDIDDIDEVEELEGVRSFLIPSNASMPSKTSNSSNEGSA